MPGYNPCFQTTLVTSGKVAWALPARNMFVNFVWDEGQNILIFAGEAHVTAAAGVLFKPIIKVV